MVAMTPKIKLQRIIVKLIGHANYSAVCLSGTILKPCTQIETRVTKKALLLQTANLVLGGMEVRL